MAEKPTIMVQIADRAWTLDAVHAACRMGRRSPAVIALISMIPVQHPGWLGTEWGSMDFSDVAKDDLEDYQDTVLDYGLDCRMVQCQYIDFVDGLADAAEQLNAQIVFAKLPPTLIPAWHRLQVWLLKRRLSRQQRQLVEASVSLPAMPTVDEPAHEVSNESSVVASPTSPLVPLILTDF